MKQIKIKKMPVPKKKTSRSRTRRRKAHHGLKKLSLSKCPKCGAKILPHRMCKKCGFYKKYDILKIEAKAERKKVRKRAAEKRKK